MQNDGLTGDNSFSDNKLPNAQVSNTLHDLKAVDPYRLAEQTRVLPRQVSTGVTRGEQQVQGSWVVVDRDGNTRMLIGYKEDAF